MSANTKFVQLDVPVPRDPSEYRASTHIGQRQRERVPEELRGRVINECITEGYCRGTTPRNDQVDVDDVSQFFAFESWLEDTHWRVVVGIRPAAFLDRRKKHLAVTVMEVHDDD